MESLRPGASLTSFEISLLADAAFGILIIVSKWLYARFASRRPSYRRGMVGLFLASWVFSNVGYTHYVRDRDCIFLGVSSALIFLVLVLELNQFWRVGLVGADAQISKGIDYVSALNMASNSLDFLGIGASKLTEQLRPFEKAVNRCDSLGRPLRFLLSTPENADLEEIARKGGVDRDAYRSRVRESLRVIANLRNDRSKNIEVRFYDKIPAFRLMFIDDEICLMSHYVLGKGDGSQLPQLHIIRKSGSQDVESLYYGFHEYFENIWERSDHWDFRMYLE